MTETPSAGNRAGWTVKGFWRGAPIHIDKNSGMGTPQALCGFSFGADHWYASYPTVPDCVECLAQSDREVR